MKDPKQSAKIIQTEWAQIGFAKKYDAKKLNNLPSKQLRSVEFPEGECSMQIRADAGRQIESRSWSITVFMQFWSIPGILETSIAIGVGFANPFATLVLILV